MNRGGNTHLHSAMPRKTSSADVYANINTAVALAKVNVLCNV